MEERVPNPHPGEVLREDYLAPLGKTAEWLAAGLRMPLSEVNEILDAKRPITAETALRLNRLFGAKQDGGESVQKGVAGGSSRCTEWN